MVDPACVTDHSLLVCAQSQPIPLPTSFCSQDVPFSHLPSLNDVISHLCLLFALAAAAALHRPRVTSHIPGDTHEVLSVRDILVALSQRLSSFYISCSTPQAEGKY